MSQLNLLNDIFVQYPGDFLYFLLLITLTLASLLMTIGLFRRAETRRYPIALAGVTVGWLLMLIGTVYAQVAGQDTNVILPPLERALSTINLLFIAWAFVTSGHNRWRNFSNTVLVILLVVIGIGYLLTASSWSGIAATTDFNLSAYGVAWTFIPLVVALSALACIVYLFADISDAPIKMVFFVIIALGTMLTLYQSAQASLVGNYAGIVRLSFVLGLVLVLMVIYRTIISNYEFALTQQPAATPAVASDTPSQPAKISAPPVAPPRLSPIEMQSIQLLKSLGMILEGTSPEKLPHQIVHTALAILRADIGAILRLQDANYADVTAAYDTVMERELSGIALNLDDQPTLVNTIERHRLNALYFDRNMNEINDFYTRLDIEQKGPVYFQPLVYKGESIAVLMVALPYASRELDSDEKELLKGLGIISANFLALSYAAQDAARLAEDRIIQEMVEGMANVPRPDENRQGTQENLQAARYQIDELNQQVKQLTLQLDDERTRLASLLGDLEESLSISQRIVAIHAEQDDLRRERDRLAKRLQEAEAAFMSATATDSDIVVKNIIESLRKEKMKLQSEKERIQQELDNFRAQDKSFVPADVQRLLNRMMAEKTRLQKEHAQLGDKLETIQVQLRELGIDDDVAGLSTLITQLSAERTSLQEQNRQLQTERDALLREREKLADNINHERDRDDRLQSMRSNVENLATDREAIVKQRDKLRAERDELYQKLNAVKENRAHLLAQVSGFELELEDAREEHLTLQNQLRELSDERSALLHKQETLLAEQQALAIERDQLLAQVDGDPSRLQQVNEEGVGSLRQMIEELSAERDKLQRELNLTRTDLAEISHKLELVSLTTAKNGGEGIYQPQHPDLMVGLVQELRTPMTSISGYIDLLLGESAGILGEMQRKFLQRVSANISRLDNMIDSLVNMTELDTGEYQLNPRPINIVSLVEDAITNATMQFREKELIVDMELEDSLPLLPADKDSMTQVIGQLLTNAYLVSPPNSELHIIVNQRPVRLYEDQLPRPCLYVAVEDRGGGIDPEDIPRVFARKYKAENPLIQGLGDTGVGMSIAKALIEAHQGRLWVESKNGIGSVFAFAVPLDLELQPEEE